MNCPYYGSNKFAKVEPENPNIKYALTEVNIATKEFNPAKGIPVDLYGCLDCKAIIMKSDRL